jgi:hypothetical protein
MSAARLENLAGVLGSALTEWAERDQAKGATAEQIHAANLAIATIDDALALLHRVRSGLIGEYRADSDERAVRVDQLLEDRRARREAGQ